MNMQEIQVGDKIYQFPDDWSDRQVEYYIKNDELNTANPTPTAAQETSPLESGLIGAGRTLNKMYAGTLGRLFDGDQSQEQAERDRIYGQLQQEHPWATTAGEIAPFLATAPLSGGLLTQMGIGGAMGASQYGANQGTQGILDAAMSGAGMGVGKVGSQIWNTAKRTGSPHLAPEATRLAERSQGLDMFLTPGSIQGSTPLRQLEASLKSLPPTSGVFQKGAEKNQKVINRLALESIGESGDEVAGKYLADAADRIGGVYENIAKNVKVMPVKGLKQFKESLSVDAERYIDKYLKKFPTLENGYLRGQDFIDLKKMTTKDIRNAYKAGGIAADDIEDFQQLIFKSLEEVSPEAKRALGKAGKQWRNLKALESGKVVTKGNVNPRSLDTKLRQMDKGGYLRGRNQGDYYDAIRIANQFGDIVGDSGTATRSWGGWLAQEPTTAAMGALTLNPLAKQYLKTGGSPFVAGLLGAVPASRYAGSTGAAAGRGLLESY